MTAIYKLTLKGDGVSIDKAIDSDVASAVMSLVMGGTSMREPARSTPRQSRRQQTPVRRRGGSQGSRRRTRSLGTVPNLKLRPAGKKAFVDFAAEKAPSSHRAKQAVIIFWLRGIAGISGVTVDHVNTCYTAARWARPSNLANSLAVTAHKTRWLDTSNMDDLQLTTLGEDLVNHDLPAGEKRKK